MNDSPRSMEELTTRILAWAEASPDVRAAIVIGSRARTDRPADEWSDLDLVVVATDPERYLSEADWLAPVGNVWMTFLEGTIVGTRERRVLFEGMLDVDFSFFSPEQFRQVGSDPELVASVFRRGVRVLVDRDGLVAAYSLDPGPPPAARPPTEQEFLNAVHDFWYHAVWTTKKLSRGELWVAKSCCDGYMKRLLREMMEWHARATRGQDHDTWHDGRFLETWADPRAVAGLRDVCAYYDAADVRRALRETMKQFRWLAKEAAARLDYPYPNPADERATTWVEAHLG